MPADTQTSMHIAYAPEKMGLVGMANCNQAVRCFHFTVYCLDEPPSSSILTRGRILIPSLLTGNLFSTQIQNLPISQTHSLKTPSHHPL